VLISDVASNQHRMLPTKKKRQRIIPLPLNNFALSCFTYADQVGVGLLLT
jgi:hypothetical protein